MDNRFGDIETFLAVANGGSFAAAAKALRLTPSEVSHNKEGLEERVGPSLTALETSLDLKTPFSEPLICPARCRCRARIYQQLGRDANG